jgi:hypothetical protein
MPIDFPISPTTGQVYTYQGKSWIWNGTGWDVATPSFLPPFAAGNVIINGAFDINQRNFTSTTTEGFGFDRWAAYFADGTTTYSRQVFTPGTSPSGYEASSFARLQTSGQSATSAYAHLVTPLEDVREFAGQTVTLSFFAKAASGSPKIAIEFRQKFGSGGSPSPNLNTYAGQATLSTSWTRQTITFTIPSIAGKVIGTTANTSSLDVVLWTSAGSAFADRTGSLSIQNNTFDIWGVQLEAGTVATPFRRNAPSIQAELAACQRYYEKGASQMFVGFFTNNAVRNGNTHYRVIKRVTPTVTFNFAGFSGDLGVNSPENSSYYIYTAANSSEPYVSWTASAEL